MSNFVLKKGTVVGHGTSLARLPGILQQGLQRGAERAPGRMITELAPESRGLYVGDLMAYFGAYAQYSAEVAPIMQDQSVMTANMKLMMSRDARHLLHMDLPPIPLTFPLVIKIQLEEDCEVNADEDFVADGKYPADQSVPPDMLRAEAQLVWERWRTSVILRDIPPSWFVGIEYPRVVTTGNFFDAMRHVFADCELFSAAMMQSFKREDPNELMRIYQKKHGKLALSQSMAPTGPALQRLLSLNGFSDDANRLANHFSLFNCIDHMAREYDIPVARHDGDRVVLDRNGYAENPDAR